MAKQAVEPTIVEHVTLGRGEVIGAKLTFGRSLPCLVVQFDGRTREIVCEPEFWRELDERITEIFERFLALEAERQRKIQARERVRKLKAKRAA